MGEALSFANGLAESRAASGAEQRGEDVEGGDIGVAQVGDMPGAVGVTQFDGGFLDDFAESDLTWFGGNDERRQRFGLGLGEGGLDLVEDGLGLDVADHDKEGVIGDVAFAVVGVDIGGAEFVEDVGIADDGEAVRALSVGGLEEAAAGPATGVVVVHVHFAADDLEFLGQFGVGEGGVLHDIGEDIDGETGAGCGDIDPVNGAIERGVGVHVTAGLLDFLIDAAGAAAFGALKEHMFQDVREAGAEPATFVDTAGAAPGLGGDDGGAVIFADDDHQTVIEGGQGGVVGEGGQWMRRDGGGDAFSFHNGGGERWATGVGSHPAGGCGWRGDFGSGQKGLTERELEVVAGLEVFASVLIRLAEHALAVFDQVEHDIAEVGAGMNPPLLEREEGHGSEGFEGVESNPLEQLLAGDVAIGDFAAGAGGFMDGLLGMIEGFANEVVGFAGVAAIELRDFIYDFVKMDRMHRTGY